MEVVMLSACADEFVKISKAQLPSRDVGQKRRPTKPFDTQVGTSITSLPSGAAWEDPYTKMAYKLQGHATVQGIPIAIENRKGSVRKGKNEDGTEWKTKFKVPYGYIKDTKGADDEEIDAYVGPNKSAPKAYVVHQKKDDGSYDEDTVMLGFKSKAEAKKAILAHYDDPKYVGNVVTVALDKLKELLASKKKLTKIANGDMLEYFQKNPQKLKEYLKRKEKTAATKRRLDEQKGDVPDADMSGDARSQRPPKSGQGQPPPAHKYPRDYDPSPSVILENISAALHPDDRSTSDQSR